MPYKDINNKRKIVINYIKKNPKTTYKDIRKNTKIHTERIFKNMDETFKEAGIPPPRTFKRNTKEENRKIIIDYIKKNPVAGGHTILRDTKRNPADFFGNIKKAYKMAGIKYPREESYKISPNKKRELIIKTIKENPYLTLPELTKKLKIKNIYRLFKNLNEIYKKAGIEKMGGGEKIKNRKRKEVIKFIKINNLATQREINKTCKTKVQEIFNRGIFEAYEIAGIKYPFERLKLYGTALKKIKKRARDFEEEISVILSGYGKVNRLVKTKRGVADIILERKNEKMVIEVKDYQNKDISFSQVKQLNRYLEDCLCQLGILVCHKKPKKDSFLIGKNKIFILEKQELNKISNIAGE